jgi:hypothetical protein
MQLPYPLRLATPRSPRGKGAARCCTQQQLTKETKGNVMNLTPDQSKAINKYKRLDYESYRQAEPNPVTFEVWLKMGCPKGGG